MIHRLCDLIGSDDCHALTPVGYRIAVPMPFMGGLLDRLRDAWAVLKGFDNHGRGVAAVRWPECGELEIALKHVMPVQAGKPVGER
jgi:hypothetical protein